MSLGLEGYNRYSLHNLHIDSCSNQTTFYFSTTSFRQLLFHSP